MTNTSFSNTQEIRNKYITVSEITQKIAGVLAQEIGYVYIKGEISNLKFHQSGHRYFSLKDENAQISCVMWKSRPLNYEISDGMTVVIYGSINVYPTKGTYNINVYSLKPEGRGALYQAFEELKYKLEKLGYFDKRIKKAIPNNIYNIGVSTSPTGAAIQDIFSTIKRRFPLATIYFRPTTVQGDTAAPDIVQAIEELNQTPSDVIIIGRGGGSLEDLWAYNMESVANAIHNSNKPIISAVGHETDYSISDFTADLRAPTPTAAAEFATPITINDISNEIDNAHSFIITKINNLIDNYKGILYSDYIKNIHRSLLDNIRNNNKTIEDKLLFLNHNIDNTINLKKLQINNLDKQYQISNPLAPFDNGFALLKHNNKIINQKQPLSDFDIIDIVRKDDITKAKIIK